MPAQGLFAATASELRLEKPFERAARQMRGCINVIDGETGPSTEFLEPDPAVAPARYDEFLSRYGELVAASDAVTITGSLPTGAPDGFYVRLGARHPNAAGRESYLRNVVIENVVGEAASQIASSVTGVPGLRPQNITIRNVRLKLMGGVTAEEANRPVPEAVKNYPENRMFGRHPLPAFGFYVRHVDGMTFENVELAVDRPDARPDIVADDVTQMIRTRRD